jgi:hypothetical protein
LQLQLICTQGLMAILFVHFRIVSEHRIHVAVVAIL